jgi:small ligand-binding sensory domain FIST
MPQHVTPTFHFASAVSGHAHTRAAIDEVVGRLSEQFASPADLMLVFVTPHHIEGLGAIHEALTRRFEPRCELGVTAEGVLGIRREIESEPGLSVLVGSMPGAELRAFAMEADDFAGLLDDNDAALAALGHHGQPPRAVMLMADPFTTPIIKLLPALDLWFPGSGSMLVGGVASGTRTAGGNRLLCNGRIARGGAVGLSIGAGVHVQPTVSQGCRPIGSPLVITKTMPDKSHVVLELGGKNPLGMIHELVHELEEDDQELVQTNGLLVGCVIDEYKRRFGRGDFLIRGIIGVDQDAGHIAIGDPHLRVGQTIQFQLRDAKTAEEDFALLLEAQKLHGDVSDGSGGAILFTCNGRGQRLFDHPHADANLVHDALGNVPLAGCFAAGEFGPIRGHNHVHGHTASLVVLRPDTP